VIDRVAAVRLHRRQFVIGPRPLGPFDDWGAVELGDGLVLSHDPVLPVRRSGAAALIGVAVQTVPGRPGPVRELDAAAADDGLTGNWAGRWILVAEGRLRLDPTGTLACFHRNVGGELWASSSPELLRTMEPELPTSRSPIVHGRGMDWFPPPASGVPGVECLLPSQVLRLVDGHVEPIPLPTPGPKRPYEEILDGLARRLTTAMSNAGATTDEVWAPLTAGGDSRLVLAAAVSAGLPVRTYTFHFPGIPSADRDLPPRLARAVGVEHHAIPPGACDPRRLDLWDRHTAGHAVDADRDYFACGQFDPLAGPDIVLGGNVFETGRGYYYAALPAELPATPEATAALLERELPSARPDGVLAWASWLHRTRDHALDWRDRFYIEQRLAGWLATIGQGTDLAGVDYVHLANCAAYLAETLAIEEDVRRAGRHQGDLLRRLAPALAELPVNPAGPPLERLRARVRREREEYRTQPTMARYLAHRVRRYTRKRSSRRRARSAARLP
jgi:hypothetical protein